MGEKKGSSKAAAQLSLREELLGQLSAEEFGLKKREISVMTRMSSDVVEILDALVELEIFKSRSEAVAAFVEKSIASRGDLFDEIKVQAKEITRMRETAKRLAFKAMQDKS
ncbi:MAG: hypothetical protein ACFFAX_06485 [Promethearchaeota archaeon]